MVCAFYRMTPEEVGSQTPGELVTMLDGMDWVSDREWERAMFVRTQDARAARKLLELSYPHYQTDRVVEVIEADHSADPPKGPPTFEN